MSNNGGSVRRLAGGVLAVVVVLIATSCYKPFDFDNDDRADLMVLDGTTAAWTRLGEATPVWTGPGGFPVPGDYDGNGAWEPAEAGVGSYFTSGPAGTIDFPSAPCPSSSSGQVQRVPRDYDADAKTDPAYYCDNTGTFVIHGQAPVVFGSTGTGHNDPDYPVPADYDGDGRADLATYNPRSGNWHIRSSNNGSEQNIPFRGIGLTFPTPGDFDGDRHADIAYFSWGDRSIHVLGGAVVALPAAANPATVLPIPAIADYDGDGKDDVSVFDLYPQYPNPATGYWHIVDSSTGTPRTLAVAPTTGQNYRIPVASSFDLVTKVSAWTLIERCLADPTIWGC